MSTERHSELTPKLPPELTMESFLRWAEQVGLALDPAHAEELLPDVRGLLARLAMLDDIDTSSVQPGIPPVGIGPGAGGAK